MEVTRGESQDAYEIWTRILYNPTRYCLNGSTSISFHVRPPLRIGSSRPEMSSPAAPAIRDELTAALKEKSSHYWETLSAYLTGKIPRGEYEEIIREAVDTPHLGTCWIPPPPLFKV